MKLHFVLILSMSFFQTSFAQQIELSEDPFAFSYYHPSPAFQNIFYSDQQTSFGLYDSSDYVKHRVRKVSVFDKNGQLWFEANLDNDGNLLSSGRKGMRFFISSKVHRLSEFEHVLIINYNENGATKRIDSTFIQKHVYTSGDTVLTYSTNRMKKYYLGSLINEQNEYYNTRYRNVKIKDPDNYAITQIPIVSYPDKKPRGVYFRKAYPVDYQEDLMYLYLDEQIDMEDSGTKGNYSLEHQDIKSHSFFANYGSKNIYEYPIPSSLFMEPSYLVESMYCGNSIYSQQHYYDGRHLGTTKNNKGLITEFWEDYYPEDPNPEPAEIPADDNSIYVIDGSYVQRLDKAIRTIKFTVEFEYFK